MISALTKISSFQLTNRCIFAVIEEVKWARIAQLCAIGVRLTQTPSISPVRARMRGAVSLCEAPQEHNSSAQYSCIRSIRTYLSATYVLECDVRAGTRIPLALFFGTKSATVKTVVTVAVPTALTMPCVYRKRK